MSGILSRLVSESAIYGLGAAASQVVGIILIPLYARELGVASYGVLAVFSTTISLSTVLAGLALSQAFLRSYLKDSITDQQRRHVLRAVITMRLGISVAAAAILALLAEPIAVVLFGSTSWQPHVLLVAGIVLLDTVTVVPLSYLRAERRAVPYALLALTRAVLGSALIVVFVVVSRLDVFGALLGSAIAAAVTAAAGALILLIDGRFGLAWDWPLTRAMLAFSLPLVPAAAASWALSFVDRYFLQAIVGSEAVGIYAAGYTVGLVINVFVVQPFTLMWAAAKWDIYRERPDAPQVFARVASGFVIAGSLAALAIGALGTDAIRILLTEAFDEARFVVPFSAFAAVLYGLYTLTGTGLNVEGRTAWISASFGAAAILNVSLNVVLIPSVGFMGAAVATVASYLFLAVTTGVLSHRFYPIPWELGRVALAIATAFALAMVAVTGPDSILWRLACVLAFVPLMLVLRVVRRADLAALQHGLRRR